MRSKTDGEKRVREESTFEVRRGKSEQKLAATDATEHQRDQLSTSSTMRSDAITVGASYCETRASETNARRTEKEQRWCVLLLLLTSN